MRKITYIFAVAAILTASPVLAGTDLASPSLNDPSSISPNLGNGTSTNDSSDFKRWNGTPASGRITGSASDNDSRATASNNQYGNAVSPNLGNGTSTNDSSDFKRWNNGSASDNSKAVGTTAGSTAQ